MTEENMKSELIMNNRPSQVGGSKPISDDVIIEIVHAFKDIIIELINKKYQSSVEKKYFRPVSPYKQSSSPLRW